MHQEFKKFKVIIDTNILISFLIGGTLKDLPILLDQNRLSIITSDEQIEELLEVVGRKKFQKYFTKPKIEEFLKLFEEKSQITKLKTKLEICRDKKDNYILSMAIDSGTDYLITGDKDILTLNKIGKTMVITYLDFNTMFNKNST